MTTETPNTDVVLEAPVQETTVQEKPAFDGLSNREALAKAVEIHRDGKEPEQPTKAEIRQAVEEEIDPPAGFNKEEIEAWKRKDIAGIQKGYRRIHDARTAEISRAQTAERKAREEAERERNEAKTWRELGKMAAPYIEARGSEGIPPQQAMMEALALINEIKKGDPSLVKSELKKIGIDLDKAPTQPTAALPKEIQEEIRSLREVVDEYKNEKEQQKFSQIVQAFDSIFEKMLSEKTRTGDPVFPGLLDSSEAGIAFAKELGSYASDPRYQAMVRRRFPNATFETIVREAYKDLGGKVSGDPAKVSTQANNQHLQRSRRASAAQPGRTAPRVNDSNLQGKLSNRAALAKAFELHRGH
jgi:hypothetical protein